MNMDILGKINETLIQKSGQAVKKSKEIVQIANLNGMIKMYEKELSELFCEIGELSYKHRDGSFCEDLLDLYVEVEEKKWVIEGLKEEMRALKDVGFCKECESEIPIEACFCPKCGAPVASAHAADVVTEDYIELSYPEEGQEETERRDR